MEEYIAAAIVLLLLIGFVPQNVIQQNNHLTIMEAESVISEAKSKAAVAGHFTDEIVADMNSAFAEFGIEGVIYQELTTSIKYRTRNYDSREMIKYEIGIPIKQVVANNQFYGISDADNTYVYWFKGEIASEKVSR